MTEKHLDIKDVAVVPGLAGFLFVVFGLPVLVTAVKKIKGGE